MIRDRSVLNLSPPLRQSFLLLDRKQTADAKPGVITRGATATAKGNSEISNARASLTKQDLNHSFQGERLRRETTAKVQDLNQDLPQEELPKRENKPDMDLKTRNPFAIKHSGSTENIKLLGGKSTPVSKKAGEQENKIEKETVTVAEPQASAVAKESSSLKNVNKTVASRSDLVGLTGLENYANNCYMNVVIQVLANIPEIRDYFAGESMCFGIDCTKERNCRPSQTQRGVSGYDREKYQEKSSAQTGPNEQQASRLRSLMPENKCKIEK